MTWQQADEAEGGAFGESQRQRGRGSTRRRSSGPSTQRSQRTQRGGQGAGSRRGVRKSWMPTDEDGHPVEVLTEEQRSRLHERALNLSVWHLGQSARTRQELRTTMARKDIPEDIVEATLDRLVEMGYLDDTAYAESFVRSRHEFRRQGSRAIIQALRAKGVDGETIAEAVEGIDPEDETANARLLVQRKAPSTRGMETPKRVNRLVGMLTRKGYSPGTSFSVVREVLSAEGLDNGDEDQLDAADTQA